MKRNPYQLNTVLLLYIVSAKISDYNLQRTIAIDMLPERLSAILYEYCYSSHQRFQFSH